MGYTRNLLGSDYALPFLGNPIDCPDADAQARQPQLCTIDLEETYQPDQPLFSPGNATPGQTPVYATDPTTAILDHALAATRRWLHGFSPRFHNVPASLNLNSGNLVLSFRLPNAGTADPPIQFTYNSLATELTDPTQPSEYGYGWTGLYRQRVVADNGNAWLCSLQNPAGINWTIQRDAAGRVLTIADPFLRATTLQYDNNLNLSEVMDSGGRATTFAIDANNDLTEVVSPGNCTTQFVYDNNHLLITYIDALGNRTNFAYDANRRLTSVQSPLGEVTQITYLDGSAQRVITDPRGHATTVTLDSYGNVASVQTPEGIVTQFTWDNLQRLLSATDGRGYVTSFNYVGINSLNIRRLQSISEPAGGVFGFAYNSDGQLINVTDENGNAAALSWDNNNNRITLSNAAGFTTAYGYNSNGQLQSLTDPLGYTTQLYFPRFSHSRS